MGGLCEGLCEFKAMQYMLDAEDLWTEYGKAHGAGVADLKKFLEGEGSRFHSWLANMERSIKGPFYFGAKATFVDYQVTSIINMLKGHSLNKLESKTGDLFAAYPKLKAVMTAILGLDSAKTLPYDAVLPEGYLMTEETAATY